MFGVRGTAPPFTRASGNALEQALLQAVAQRRQARAFFGQMRAGQFRGLAEAGDAGNVFRAGAAVALAVPAVHQRSQAHALAHVQRADALGPANLVRGKREQLHAELVDVDRHLAGRLHGVGVERDAGFGSDAADLFDGLQRAQLVVGVHDGDEHGLGPQRAAHFFRIDDAVACSPGDR